MAAISAHGPRSGTIEAYAMALETGAEYVEFDIRRTADGELAAYHDPRTRQGEVLAAIRLPPAVRAGRSIGCRGWRR